MDEFEDLLKTIGKPLEQFGVLPQVRRLVRPPLQNIYLPSSIFPLPRQIVRVNFCRSTLPLGTVACQIQ